MRWMTSLVLLAASAALAGDKINVVATLPNLKSIADEVGGDKVEVRAIASGFQDEHFVDPKPTFMTWLRDADLLLVNGLELEKAWINPLIEGSRNPNIQVGSKGFVDCSAGIPRIEVPTDATRAEGDVHPFGNPHYLVDPINARTVAKTICDAFSEFKPDQAAAFEEGYKAFCKKMDRAMFGEALVAAVGGQKLNRALDSGELWDFLAKETVDGKPLSDKLGGWLGNIAPARGKKMITYHKNMSFFANRFGVEVAEYVEPKPGIQPDAHHLVQLVDLIQKEGIKILLQFPFNEHGSTDLLAKKTGIKVVTVPVEAGGADDVKDYFQLMDKLTKSIGDAYRS